MTKHPLISFIQIEESKKSAEDMQQLPEPDTVFKNTFVWIVDAHHVTLSTIVWKFGIIFNFYFELLQMSFFFSFCFRTYITCYLE